MRAVVFGEHGTADVLRLAELPVPVPRPDEVRVRVEACSVNYIDLDIRAGTSRFEHPWPHILGREGVGTVAGTGAAVSDWKLGDRVIVDSSAPCGRCRLCHGQRTNLCEQMRNPGVTHPGCYAEDVIVPHDGLVACPPDLRPEVAAAMPIAFGTAWHMLVPLAQAQSGETVLILGASGGVGVATTVVATALGLPVVAVVGGREKEPHLKVLGASHTIALDGADLIDEVRRCTARRGVDIVIDLVGGPTFRQALACVATGGRLVTAGAHAGEVVDVDLVEIFRREIRVLGSRGHTREDLDAVMALLDLTSLRPIVRDVLPLESAAEAHQRLAARLGVGKLVLSIS